jgi:aspartyl protease family protein
MLKTQLQFAVVAIFVALFMANTLSRVGGPADPRPTPKSAALRADLPSTAPAPTRAALPVRGDERRIPADPLGQYTTDAEVNGARVSKMLVDTGATMVALSYEDAAAAGLYPAPAEYKYQVQTANGVAHVARVTLNDVRIGNIVVHDVDAVVGERGALRGSLLGMTFLSKLSRFSVESGALVLKK